MRPKEAVYSVMNDLEIGKSPRMVKIRFTFLQSSTDILRGSAPALLGVTPTPVGGRLFHGGFCTPRLPLLGRSGSLVVNLNRPDLTPAELY